jgi:hypothetical protein
LHKILIDLMLNGTHPFIVENHSVSAKDSLRELGKNLRGLCIEYPIFRVYNQPKQKWQKV